MAIRVDELNDTNCKTYLLEAGGEAALVDPVRERLELYRRVLRERGLALRMIIETHTHADHLMLGRDAKQVLDAPIVMHEACPSPLADRRIVDGAELELGGETIRVLETPGHTPDSVALVISGAVLTGDALLIGGSGRTDFPGGDPGIGYDSVVGKLFALPDETVVWPGHDYKGRSSSTIGAEKAGNPRFAGKSRDEYIAIMNALGLPFPDRIQEALQVNQSGFEADEVGGFPLVKDIAAITQLEPAALAAALASAEPPVVLDVREPEEFVGELGHVEGALLVPMDSIAPRLPKLAGYHDRPLVVVCRAGARSATAAVMLQQAGFKRIQNLAGGMVAWHRAGLPSLR